MRHTLREKRLPDEGSLFVHVIFLASRVSGAKSLCGIVLPIGRLRNSFARIANGTQPDGSKPNDFIAVGLAVLAEDACWRRSGPILAAFINRDAL